MYIYKYIRVCGLVSEMKLNVFKFYLTSLNQFTKASVKYVYTMWLKL